MSESESNRTALKISRRALLHGAGVAALSLAIPGCDRGPAIKTSKTPKRKLRWLGWEHYDVRQLTERFEDIHDVEVSAGYFDGNSEAYARLKAPGGTDAFDLVMADGFWPGLYFSEGLTREIDESRLPNLSHVFSDFLLPSFPLLHTRESGSRIAAPNCWGGYGITANVGRIPVEQATSLEILFDGNLKGRISTSARFEENIALAGILACHRMGTKNSERPDGSTDFNPYDLFDDELEEAKRLLIQQKRLLLARWNDEDTLERLLRSESVWVSPEWSGIYRRIHFDNLDGKTDLEMIHNLRPQEGGLGWVDTWAITTGVDQETADLAHEWINFRLEPSNMALIAEQVGWSPTVDVRKLVDQRYVDTLFLDRTSDIRGLYQFDAPSSPEKWERVWTAVESA